MTFDLNQSIWILYGLLGTLYLYHLGMKSNWQELRIKKGLVKYNTGNPPVYTQPSVFNTRIYKAPCIIFLLFSCFISLCAVGLFYLGAPKKIISNWEGGLTSFLALWFIFSLFTGSPIDKNNLPDEESNKFYIKVLTLSAVLKKFIIEKYVNSEYEYLMVIIKSKITSWYESRYANNNLGALIIRIHSGFFNKILPEGCDEGIKELLRQSSLNILNLYYRDDPTLCDELLRLFEIDMIKYGAHIIDLAEFINNGEKLGISVTNQQIDQYLKDNLSKTPTNGVKKKSSADIKNMLLKAIENKNAGGNTNIGA